MRPRRLKGPLPLYVRYCVIFIVAQLLLLTAGTLLWERLLDPTPVSTLHYRVQGSHALLADRLLQVPEAQRAEALAGLQTLFAYPLQLQPLAEIEGQLPAADADKLREGQIVVSADGAYSHQRLAGTRSVLTLGDFSNVPENDDDEEELLEDGLYWLSLLTTVAAAVALPLYFLIHRFWHDVKVLHDTVHHLQANAFSHPVPPLRTRLLRPLGHALDDLSQQLQVLLDGQRLLGQAMAHELRTPLARMRFTVGLMEEQQAVPDDEGTLLHDLQTDLQLLQDLTAASVEYLRFGRMPLVERRPVNVKTLLRNAATAICRSPGPAVTCQCCPQLTVHANEAALDLAVRNLLANAVRHAHSAVRMQAELHQGGLRLRVEDDGPGIPPAHRQQVFAPYVRLCQSTEGFGLGLAMVKAITQRHGGHVEIGDSPLGGAAVTLWLPDATPL